MIIILKNKSAGFFKMFPKFDGEMQNFLKYVKEWYEPLLSLMLKVTDHFQMDNTAQGDEDQL